MSMKVSQRGMTLLGFLMVLGVVGFFAFIGMKLFPVYSEYYSVVQSMKGIQMEPGVATMPPEKIRQLLDKRFNISYIDSVKPQDITIKREKGYNLRIAYEVRRPMVYNIDFVAKFDKTVDLTRQDGVD
jgi:DNA-dependent RNA polymerase auxiliary subunit epsilon